MMVLGGLLGFTFLLALVFRRARPAWFGWLSRPVFPSAGSTLEESDKVPSDAFLTAPPPKPYSHFGKFTVSDALIGNILLQHVDYSKKAEDEPDLMKPVAGGAYMENDKKSTVVSLDQFRRKG